MKTWIQMIVWLALIPGSGLAAGLDPYILAGIDQGSIEEVQVRVETGLYKQGFEVVGSYAPAEDKTLSVVCVTHPQIKKSVAELGGLYGFAAVLRVGLQQKESGVLVSYTHPLYWGNAYYRQRFSEIESVYADVEQAFRGAFVFLPEPRFEPFGSKKVLTAAKLQKYHYMMAMPYFDDVVELDTGASYEEAVSRIESRAAAEDSDVKIVYAVKFPEQQMALFGTALGGEKGEKKFLPTIDSADPRHVPFLPYEMLVLSNRVVSLHGKFRIALSFPDLSMGTFMKIVSTPGDIADAQRKLVATEE